MDGSVPVGQRVDDGVDRALPPGQGPGEGAGQPQHRTRVRQARREHYGTLLGEGAVHRIEPGGDRVDVERATQGVVDAHDDGDDVGPQRQSGRELPFQHVPCLRSADREVGEVHGLLRESAREQRGPAAPAAARRVAHTFGERVTECDETHASHPRPPAAKGRTGAGTS